MPSATAIFFTGIFRQLGVFIRANPFIGITTIFIGIIIIQAIFASLIVGNPTPLKEQVGDRIISADTKMYKSLTEFEKNGNQITDDGFLTKQRFIYNLFVDFWFIVAFISIIFWIMARSPVATSNHTSNLGTTIFAIFIFLIIGVLVNMWNYNFHDDNQLPTLSGWEKFKYTMTQLNPIKGTLKVISDFPAILKAGVVEQEIGTFINS